MYLIGLTGGIASGKSTVARRLAERGAIIIDADAISREVVAVGSPVLAAIAHEFGTDVLEVDGGLNRARLGGIVFGNPEQLEKLNAIMHPAVKLRSADLLAAAATNNPDGVVVYDVPLLVESDIARNYDEIVVASAPEETRVRRMMEFRGLTDAEARARIRAQAPEANRLAIADVVIDTGGDLQHTLDQVDALWVRLQHSNVS